MDVAVPIGINKVEALNMVKRYCCPPLLEVLGLVHRQPLLDLLHFVDARVPDGVHAMVCSQRRTVCRAQYFAGHRPGQETP